MGDAWNEKIPAQCTRNTKRVLQPALRRTVLRDVCSLGERLYFWEAPSHRPMHKNKQRRKWEKANRNTPWPRSTYKDRPGRRFLQLVFQHPGAAWIPHAWGRFSSSAGQLGQILSSCKDPLKPVSAAHIFVVQKGMKPTSAAPQFCASFPGLRMAWDKYRKICLG